MTAATLIQRKRKQGLSDVDSLVLLALVPGPKNCDDLAAAAECTYGGAYYSLYRLIQLGYLLKASNIQENPRRAMYFLSDEGRRHVHELLKPDEA
jgi:DNA-binding PadR family transcriptional regulator